MYHPHWGTVGVDGRAVNSDTGTEGTNGAWTQGKGRTGSEAGVCQAEARPCPAADAPTRGLRKRWLNSWSDCLPSPPHSKVQTASVDCFCPAAVAQAPGAPRLRRQRQAHTCDEGRARLFLIKKQPLNYL